MNLNKKEAQAEVIEDNQEDAKWKDHLVATRDVGGHHGDTREFDDVDQLEDMYDAFTIPKIVGIELYTDFDMHHGYQAIYSGNVRARKNIASHAMHHDRVQTIRYDLDDDEYVSSISGRSTGAHVMLVTVHTSKGRMLSAGHQDKGDPVDFNIPNDCAVVALGGGRNGHLHNFKCTYVDLHKFSARQQKQFAGEVIKKAEPENE